MNIDWKQVFTDIDTLRKKDNEVNDKLKELWLLLDDHVYAPSFCWSELVGYMMALRVVLSETQMNWVEYYTYEAYVMQGEAQAWLNKDEDKSYDFKKIDEAVAFMEALEEK